MKLSDLPAGEVPTKPLKLSDLPQGEIGPSKEKDTFERGVILPLARNVKTGEYSLSVPEMIAEPVRGLVQLIRDVSGKGRPAGSNLTGDELNALATLAGGGAGAEFRAGFRALPKTAAEIARSKGYVLPPQMAGKGGVATKALSAIGGKIKLRQEASIKNQPVTNRLAAESLGLPPDTVLTDKVLKDVRTKAGAAYENISLAIPEITADATYKKDIQQLGDAATLAAQYFPKLMNNPAVDLLRKELIDVDKFPPRAGLELVKKLRAEAVENLRAIGDPSKHALGLAYRKAADAIDDLMGRNVQAAGKGKLIDNYREARKLIAKSYDVESVTNTATGDVSARGLARLQSKRPLTDQLKDIAEASDTFRKALQDSASFGGPETFSIFDAAGGLAGLASGSPEIWGIILGRPVVRKLLLSRLYQDHLLGPKPPALTRYAPAIGASLDNLLSQGQK